MANLNLLVEIKDPPVKANDTPVEERGCPVVPGQEALRNHTPSDR